VGEIAQLLMSGAFTAEGDMRDQMLPKAAYIKDNETRTVFVGMRLRKELERDKLFFTALPCSQEPLLQNQMRTAFSPDTLCQLFSQLYARAGVNGASTHSGRRSFTTKLRHSGVSPKVIMTLAAYRQNEHLNASSKPSASTAHCSTFRSSQSIMWPRTRSPTSPIHAS